MSKPRRGRRGAGYGARDNAASGSGPGSSRHGWDVLINASSPLPSGRGLFPWGLGRTQGAPAKSKILWGAEEQGAEGVFAGGGNG